MRGPQATGRVWVIVLALLLALLPVLGLAARGSAAQPIAYPAFADPAFQGVWARYDRPVYYGAASRSYVWGSAVTQGMQEAYADGPNGQHFVQYFDKSRMEINDPVANASSPFYVTQGLLASEMINGRIQIGDAAFQQSYPAPIPLGDLDDTQASSPTYASFRSVLGASPIPAGQAIVATIDRAGNVTNDANPQGVTSAGVLAGVPTNHSIASVFLDFLLSQGPVYIDGQNVTQAIFDPLVYVTGYPITEAYWAMVKAANVNRTILIQCFERRCLTYNPANEPAFRVEFANTGLQYYQWRYKGAIPPTIGAITVTTAATGAALGFATTPPSSVGILYHPTGVSGQEVLLIEETPAAMHLIVLTGLDASTSYTYRITATTPEGGRTTGDAATFTTQATPPPGPAIGQPVVVAGPAAAAFTVTTTPAATVHVVYWVQRDSATAVFYTDPAGMTTTHQFSIAPLLPNTSYTYRIVATAPDGGITVADHAFFKTPALP